MTEPSVAAIVPTWNGLADTRECLRSLCDHDYPNLTVVVVDNGSQDGTPERVRAEFPSAHLIENGRNLGFARACNVGAAYAAGCGTTYLLFLNSDATLDPGCVHELVGVAGESPEVGIVGVLARHAADPARVEAGHEVHWWTGQICPVSLPPHPPRSVGVDYVWGCGLLVRTALFRRLGGFRSVYGSYFEDADLCQRVARLGCRTVVATRATILHKVSRTADRMFLRQVYLRARNLLLFFLLNSPRRCLPAVIPLCLGYRVPRVLYDHLHLYLAHRLRGRFPERSISLVPPRTRIGRS